MTDPLRTNTPRHLLTLGHSDHRERVIDYDRLFTDPVYRATMGGHTAPRAQSDTSTEEVRIIVEEARRGGDSGYSVWLVVESNDDDLQTIYDWSYERFGLDSQRWSITGGKRIGFAVREDADMVLEQWNGYGAGAR